MKCAPPLFETWYAPAEILYKSPTSLFESTWNFFLCFKKNLKSSFCTRFRGKLRPMQEMQKFVIISSSQLVDSFRIFKISLICPGRFYELNHRLSDSSYEWHSLRSESPELLWVPQWLVCVGQIHFAHSYSRGSCLRRRSTHKVSPFLPPLFPRCGMMTTFCLPRSRMAEFDKLLVTSHPRTVKVSVGNMASTISPLPSSAKRQCVL